MVATFLTGHNGLNPTIWPDQSRRELNEAMTKIWTSTVKKEDKRLIKSDLAPYPVKSVPQEAIQDDIQDNLEGWYWTDKE